MRFSATMFFLTLFVPSVVSAACDEPGCWRLTVLAQWTVTVDADGQRNQITVNERYPGKCQATRDLQNVVPDPNTEVWQCWYDAAGAEDVQGDGDFFVLAAEEKVTVWSCTNPAYANQIDCETIDYACSDPTYDNQGDCEANGNLWVGTQRGVWTSEDVWQ